MELIVGYAIALFFLGELVFQDGFVRLLEDVLLGEEVLLPDVEDLVHEAEQLAEHP